MKKIELDTGFEIIGFDKKEIKKLLKNEDKFKMEVTCVSSRDILDITVSVKKDTLKLKVKCPGCESNEYECDNSAKELKGLIREILTSQYN